MLWPIPYTLNQMADCHILNKMFRASVFRVQINVANAESRNKI